MIGEIWESSETWLNGDMFDSTMNYDFRKNCRDFFALRKISAEEFHDRIVKMLLRYRTGTLRGQLNLLDSHGSCRTARETCEDSGWQRCSCLPLPEFPAYSMGMNWEWTAVARQHCGGPCPGKRCRMKRMISFPG